MIWGFWRDKGHLEKFENEKLEKLEKNWERKRKIEKKLEEAKERKKLAKSKKKKLEIIDWCLGAIEESCGDWEEIARREMEEIEEDMMLNEVVERRERRIAEAERKKAKFKERKSKEKSENCEERKTKIVEEKLTCEKESEEFKLEERKLTPRQPPMMTNSPEKRLEKPKFKQMFETFQNHDVEQHLDATRCDRLNPDKIM